MSHFFKAILLGAALIAGQAHAQDTVVDGSYQISKLTWGDSHGVSSIAWKVVTSGEKVYICGAVQHSNGTAAKLTRQALGKSWVKQGEKKIMRGLSFFRGVGVNKELAGAKVKCRAAKTTNANGPFEIGINPGKVYL